MNKYPLIILPLLLIIIAACGTQDQSGDNSRAPAMDAAKGEIVFERVFHDLGIIVQGETVGCNFAFTNTGEGSVMILDAHASCGCTVPRFSKEPVAPGGRGTVEVMFDSEGRIGKQSKTVTIRTNGMTEDIRLNIVAEIVQTNT
jgi:hypothetical protein